MQAPNSLDFRPVTSLVLNSLFLAGNYVLCLVQVATTCRSVFRYHWICLPMQEMQEIWGFDPWVRKIPWSRKWQPIPVFMLGKSHRQKNLVGYSPQESQRVRHDWSVEHTSTGYNEERDIHLWAKLNFCDPLWRPWNHLLWSEYLCLPKIHMLKSYPPNVIESVGSLGAP